MPTLPLQVPFDRSCSKTCSSSVVLRHSRESTSLVLPHTASRKQAVSRNSDGIVLAIVSLFLSPCHTQSQLPFRRPLSSAETNGWHFCHRNHRPIDDSDSGSFPRSMPDPYPVRNTPSC